MKERRATKPKTIDAVYCEGSQLVLLMPDPLGLDAILTLRWRRGSDQVADLSAPAESVLDARIAGTRPDRRDTTSRITIIETKVTGSVGSMPYKSEEIIRVPMTDTTVPIATPIPARTMV